MAQQRDVSTPPSQGQHPSQPFAEREGDVWPDPAQRHRTRREPFSCCPSQGTACPVVPAGPREHTIPAPVPRVPAGSNPNPPPCSRRHQRGCKKEPPGCGGLEQSQASEQNIRPSVRPSFSELSVPLPHLPTWRRLCRRRGEGGRSCCKMLRGLRKRFHRRDCRGREPGPAVPSPGVAAGIAGAIFWGGEDKGKAAGLRKEPFPPSLWGGDPAPPNRAARPPPRGGMPPAPSWLQTPPPGEPSPQGRRGGEAARAQAGFPGQHTSEASVFLAGAPAAGRREAAFGPRAPLPPPPPPPLLGKGEGRWGGIRKKIYSSQLVSCGVSTRPAGRRGWQRHGIAGILDSWDGKVRPAKAKKPFALPPAPRARLKDVCPQPQTPAPRGDEAQAAGGVGEEPSSGTGHGGARVSSPATRTPSADKHPDLTGRKKREAHFPGLVSLFATWERDPAGGCAPSREVTV